LKEMRKTNVFKSVLLPVNYKISLKNKCMLRLFYNSKWKKNQSKGSSFRMNSCSSSLFALTFLIRSPGRVASHKTVRFLINRSLLTNPVAPHKPSRFSQNRSLFNKPFASHKPSGFSQTQSLLTKPVASHKTVRFLINRSLLTNKVAS